MKAIIVGAGIGGMTAALALSRQGVDVELYERAGEILPLGAGLSLWSNAVACLSELGLREPLLDLGVEMDSVSIRASNGTVLSRLPLQQVTQKLGHPSLCIQRAVLQQTLLSALPEGVLNLGCELIGFKQDDDGVRIQFHNRREAHGDLLIGADGLHSTIRSQVINDAPPRYSGYGGWLGMARLQDESFRVGHAVETWGRGKRFGMLHCGGGFVYWFCTTNQSQPLKSVRRGRKQDILNVVQGWHDPIPDVVTATEEDRIVELSFFDRKPLRKWTHGRISLLGDSAHPMTPNMGQGACQAIEDAVTLADCLRCKTDPLAGLPTYDMQRIKRTSRFVRQSRRLGRFLQNENAVVCWLRNNITKLIPANVHIKQMVKQFQFPMVAG